MSADDARRPGHSTPAPSAADTLPAADALPDESADVTAELLRRGVPLTLLADLLSPFGPDSDRIVEEERGAEEPED